MRVPPRTQGKTQARADASAVSRRLVLPVQRYIHAEEAAGLMLAIGAAIGLIWANSPWARSYEALLHKHMAVHLGPLALDKSLHHWINDGLMSLFFVVVGLEINREMVHGQLRHIRGAALPLFAAIGGMVVPAAAYLLFNAGTDGARGWGIPVATDIAFALGALAVLGDRVPHALRIFLLAFAAGWLLIALLSPLTADGFHWWPLIPGGIIGGLGALILAGDAGLQVLRLLGYAWPLALIAAGAWILLRRRA